MVKDTFFENCCIVRISRKKCGKVSSIILVKSCDILVNIEPQTFAKVYVQATFYNDTKSPVYTFDGDQKTEKIRLKGMICSLKPTKFDLYTKYPAAGVKPKATSSAFLEGYGMVNYIVLADGIFMGARAGVACSIGDCGASRG
ncbi:unnamed protein product [Caenorhabditis angaria]|uniref:Uncharacterized protein n=1 Tax=Caenorhabditis angaria TaxID=860376 RepID=A0A9P1N0Y8_9PELO|nr:unnamed protein product [Caenorhabditis angaria]